jgi:hypothetical protein
LGQRFKICAGNKQKQLKRGAPSGNNGQKVLETIEIGGYPPVKRGCLTAC